MNISDLDKNMPILIVDDFSTVRRVVKNCLAQLGFKNVLEAGDADTAIQTLKDNQVDLIISDWQIPNMDGLDLHAMLKQDNKFKSLPVLMVVPEMQKKDLQKDPLKCKEEFIVKPFTRDALQNKINNLFAEK